MDKIKELIIFENQSVKLEVNMKDETVWLTQKQMAELFNKSRTSITMHINNIFREGELEEKSNVSFIDIANSDKPVKVYSLDIIISVGYRVKSKNGIIFRKWANSVLKDYLLKGYSVNQKRLEQLEKTVKLIDITSRAYERLDGNDAKEIIKVIDKYSKGLDILDNYDNRRLNKITGTISDKKITYELCLSIIKELKYNENSNIFALERNLGLASIINTIYQTFDGKDVYSSVEEKAANFLYLIVKNHVFIDGNKRIGACLFIFFLSFYNILYKDDNFIIDSKLLAALTLLIAESNPREKEILISLTMNFLV